MTSYLAGPSLAAATGTRLDSAAKHIQQCRVSQDHMQDFVTFDKQCDADELIRNKYRYCVHKDELVLGIAKSWTSNKRFINTAYPRVISNLGRLADSDVTGKSYNEAIRMMIYMYHNAVNIPTRNLFLQAFVKGTREEMDRVIRPDGSGETYFQLDQKNPNLYGCKSMLSHMYDFNTVGYANTLGYAHAHNGDTMTSVHIGGLRTVQNGHFEMFCGDVIQWYWAFERPCFDDHGKRQPITANVGGDEIVFLNQDPCARRAVQVSHDAEQRKEYFERQYGQKKGVMKHVPMIKPFKRDDIHPRIYDWYRCFATAISSARPFEMVDIRISRQAL